MNSSKLKAELKRSADPTLVKIYLRFFKTAKGEYGEGDRFIGVKVPAIRKITKKYIGLPLKEITKLLNDPLHELRTAAVVLLTEQYQKADKAQKEKIAKFYLKNTKGINNWDLVDISAPKVLGHYFFDKDRSALYKFARSKDLWKERIAIMSTFYFIRQKDYSNTLKLSKFFLTHKHDLIHKAVGWMLREIGNRDKKVEVAFLKKHYKKMPRTMLRYAIEKFPKKERDKYLKDLI